MVTALLRRPLAGPRRSASGQSGDSSWLRVVWAMGAVALFVFIFTSNTRWTSQEIAVISATLYTDERSGYPANTIVLLFSSQKGFWLPRPLICATNNATTIMAEVARVRYAFTPIYICQWSVYLMICPAVVNPSSFSLTDTRFTSGTVNVPYRVAVKKKMGVVACFSPLFYNERWQLIVPTLEIYRQLGVDLQVYYVQSMLQEIMDFLKVYERLNVAQIETWNGVRLDPARDYALGYDPNAELEWRNQAAAHTDCFLNYKQAAEFIIVSDIDDILFPKLGATYLEEFRRLTAVLPFAAGFSYNRYNTEIVTSKSSADFSLSTLIASARVADEWEDGKYVVRPQHAETVWLHWPGIMKSGYSMYAVDDDVNLMIHMRNWSMLDPKSVKVHKPRDFNLFKYQIGDVVRPSIVDSLQQNFRRFLRLYASKEFAALPTEIRYYPLIAECYNRIFYNRAKRPSSCPGPLRCQLPRVAGLKCAVARRTYEHHELNNNVRVHLSRKPGVFQTSFNGCTMV